MLKIHSGEISQIARWQALDHRVIDQNSPKYIASLLPDGTTIETIDALDGKIYGSQSLPDDFGLRLPLKSLEDDLTFNWNHWNYWNYWSQLDSGGMNLLDRF